jgi:signal transduction histidine kinase
MLRIEVCDSGKGFAAEDQEKIAADLDRFNGIDLTGEGSTHVSHILDYIYA